MTLCSSAHPSHLLRTIGLSLSTVISEVCMDLNLPSSVTATACRFWHTVFPSYFSLSELTHAPEALSEAVVACVFLSAKVMEKARRLRDVISSVEYCRHKLNSDETFDISAEPSMQTAVIAASSKLCDSASSFYEPMDMKTYWRKRDACLKEETRLLKALGFVGAAPSRVYDLLAEALFLLGWTPQHYPRLVALSFGVLNDIVVTSMTCRYSDRVIVVAVVLVVNRLFGQVDEVVGPRSRSSFSDALEDTSAQKLRCALGAASSTWRTCALRHLEKLKGFLAADEANAFTAGLPDEMLVGREHLYVSLANASEDMFHYWAMVNSYPFVKP
eukprot:GHVS01096273.1.p1 GENE.GHVS01096273.1~~GHVS01096273.1.p1  ORF type:complete len:330 (+),score=45.82 GHVS01096273.1:105-1094(+)